MSNSERYPEAWKVYIDCVRKWESTDVKKYPDGWQYGIPNPKNPKKYLYSNCPGKLFIIFKNNFYSKDEVIELRRFLWRLELMEGKMSRQSFEKNTDHIKIFLSKGDEK